MNDDTTTPESFTITLSPVLVAEERDGGRGSYGEHQPYMWPAEECVALEHGGQGCGDVIEHGQPLRKVRGFWVHDECARKVYAASTPAEAWILLADAVAARPHTFKATEIRTIISNVVRIASLVSVPSPLPGGEEK